MGTAASNTCAAAPDPIAADSPRASVDDLRELMRSVDETTRALQGTHVVLQREVVRLQAELTEANAQLRRSQALAALGEMAAGIAHEIRNPLGSIRLYVQMLAEDLADAPEPVALCEKITRAVTGLDAIVRDVLLFAREMRVQCRPTRIGELIEHSLEQCAGLLATAGVICETTVEIDDDDLVALDAILVQQAIANLVRNAAEAMGQAPDGQCRIGVTASRRQVRCPDGRRATALVIGVDDAGPGIPPEVVQRMFNPFFTTRQTGTGLGLAIVHRIIEAHGGHLAVSNSPWGGARVEICLPVAVETDSPMVITKPTRRARASRGAQTAGGVPS